MKFLTKELPKDSYWLALAVEELLAARRQALEFRDRAAKIGSSYDEIALTSPANVRKTPADAKIYAEITNRDLKLRLGKILEEALLQLARDIDDDLKTILTPEKAAETK